MKGCNLQMDKHCWLATRLPAIKTSIRQFFNENENTRCKSQFPSSRRFPGTRVPPKESAQLHPIYLHIYIYIYYGLDSHILIYSYTHILLTLNIQYKWIYTSLPPVCWGGENQLPFPCAILVCHANPGLPELGLGLFTEAEAAFVGLFDAGARLFAAASMPSERSPWRIYAVTVGDMVDGSEIPNSHRLAGGKKTLEIMGDMRYLPYQLV